VSSLEPAIGSVEPHDTIVSHNHEVFDSDAKLIGEINSRFDAEYHARFEFTFVASDNVWGFVDVKPDAVACSMDEPIAVSGCLDNFAGRAIDRCGSNARFDRVDCSRLCFSDNIVYLTDTICGRTVKDDRSRLV